MHMLAQAHTYANAVLYRGTRLDPVDVEDLTVTIFRHTYPRKFFKECRKRGWTVEKKNPGVYQVEGFSYIPTQVVVMRFVDDQMLRTLVPGAKKEDIEKVLDVISDKKNNYFQQLGKDVMALLWETNGETMDEIKREGKMKGNVLDLFSDEIEKKEKAAEEKGANQQANTTAEKMLRKNKPLSEIVDFSGLTEAAVRALAEKLKLTVVAG